MAGPWFCGFWHSWTRWTTTADSTVKVWDDPPRNKPIAMRHTVEQKRTCNNCGQVELRVERVELQ